MKVTNGVPTSPRSAAGSTGLDNRELKRRGRKRVRDDIYFIQGEKKIQEIVNKLKNAKRDNMPIKER